MNDLPIPILLGRFNDFVLRLYFLSIPQWRSDFGFNLFIFEVGRSRRRVSGGINFFIVMGLIGGGGTECILNFILTRTSCVGVHMGVVIFLLLRGDFLDIAVLLVQKQSLVRGKGRNWGFG
jgi:hypothetical protein